MESWRQVWREGIVPNLSTRGLVALRNALLRDDKALLQGATCCPPPMQCVLDRKPEGVCAIGFAGWQGDGLETVGEVEEFFAKVCFDADQRIGEPAAVRFFLNAYDDWPRDEMRRELLAEVNRSLKLRSVEPASTALARAASASIAGMAS